MKKIIVELSKYFNKCFLGSNPIENEENVIKENNIKEEEPIFGAPVKEGEKYSHVKILIDNGHGVNTMGKCSPYSASKVKPAIEFKEYKWNREISKVIVEHLKEKGYNVDILVPEDIDISLTERTARVNKICKEYGKTNVLLVSVHANAAGNGTSWLNAKGWSAFTSKGHTKSDILSEYLYDAAEKYFVNRKIRVDNQDGDRDWESNFYICQKTNCAAVLTENFFYDNVDDVKYILSDEGREAVIKTHVEGIINYIKNTY
jgi:N-acetylmuramoyl-L-alanine amidase